METHKTQSWLDIPKAIVLAGLFIGIGLAFGLSLGLSGASAPKNPTPRTAGTAIEQVLKAADIRADEYQACLKDGAASQRVQDDIDRGITSGVEGTPATIIVHVPTGASALLSGAQPINVFQQVIDALRAGETVDVPMIEGDFTLDTDEHLIGNPEADIVMIEYSDYDCTFCQRVHPTLTQLVSDDGNIAWAYRHFPLTAIHPEALPKAIASECFAELGGAEAFWLFTETNFSPGLSI